MRSSFATLALAALAAANPMPQGVTSAISPSGSPLPGCSTSYSGSFEIQVVNVTKSAKREIVERQASTLVMTLSNGVLKDSKGRTGYIAANRQFQFDGPPQTGAIYTAGWSVCGNGSLAIGDDATFYQCLSGTFYNLYDEATAAQCNPVTIQVVGGAPAPSAVASQTADGQVTGSAVASQISDGQVTASAVTQISDGQIQATTGVVTQISDGQIQATPVPSHPVSQISDGQIQATTAGPAPVSQISDGQIQATTAPVVTQISDGQVQATTGAVVTQISDGQIQATTAKPVAPVTQISDGQIQATTGVVTQISDGQIQASGAATPTTSVVAYTGAAAPTAIRAEFFGLAAGVLAVAML